MHHELKSSPETVHWGVFDASLPAVLRVASGDTVTFHCLAGTPDDLPASGFDIPPFDSMLDFTIWNEVEPPRGTVYHYPIRPSHHARPHVAGSPAQPEIAMQIYSRGTQPGMLAKLFNGQAIPQVISWAEEELRGFTR